MIVREVDADRCDRARVAGLDHHFDRARGHTCDLGLAEPGIPGHVILEPLRVRRKGTNATRLLGVHVADDPLPRAFHAARIEIHLDETVDRVNRRLLIADPGDVVRDPIGLLARFVEANQCG